MDSMSVDDWSDFEGGAAVVSGKYEQPFIIVGASTFGAPIALNSRDWYLNLFSSSIVQLRELFEMFLKPILQDRKLELRHACR